MIPSLTTTKAFFSAYPAKEAESTGAKNSAVREIKTYAGPPGLIYPSTTSSFSGVGKSTVISRSHPDVISNANSTERTNGIPGIFLILFIRI